jgi:acetyl/propionyl-CoA carboxylase alpha subunit
MPAFGKVLVANRGAVAARVLHALGQMKIPSVAVYSDADAGAPYLELASETVHIGAAPARASYLNPYVLVAANQKMIEEAPAPNVDRARVDGTAMRLADKLATAGYDNIGTVEMLMDAEEEWTFLEMNTRLQVEHGVTEEITGVDLVKAQVRAAAGERLFDMLPPEIAIDVGSTA